MFRLSINTRFLNVPSSRSSTWTWSSWIRAVFSTIPSFAPAILVVKNRHHSSSENSIAFSASSCARRFAINASSLAIRRCSYAWLRRSSTNATSSAASLWYAASLESS